jgi:stage II sporulation protein AA (anti-sigma F factor antagonist)
LRVASPAEGRRPGCGTDSETRTGPDNDLIAMARGPAVVAVPTPEFMEGRTMVATHLQVESSVVSSGDADLHILVADGELDLVTAGEFQEKLDALVDGTGRRLLLDLRGLRFIDSRGITALYQARASFAHMAVVVAPDSNVARILEISGFDRALPLFGSLVEALRKLA